MVRDDGGQIDRRENVAVENNGRITDMFFGIFERAACSEGRSFHGIPNPNAEIGTVLQEILNFPWLVGQAEDDLGDFCASHEINLIEQKWGISHGHDWLRGVYC